MLTATVAYAVGGRAVLPALVNVTLASFAAMTAAQQERVVCLREEYADVLEALG